MTETPELIAFPDAEAVLVSYLNRELSRRGDAANVSTRHPSDVEVPTRTGHRFVRVTRSGGPRAHIVADGAQMVVQCWDSDEVAAAELLQLVRALVWAMAGTDVDGTWVYRVQEFSGPVNYPDPDTDMPRYQISMNVSMKGRAL